jgi:hypothetical protein
MIVMKITVWDHIRVLSRERDNKILHRCLCLLWIGVLREYFSSPPQDAFSFKTSKCLKSLRTLCRLDYRNNVSLSPSTDIH